MWQVLISESVSSYDSQTLLDQSQLTKWRVVAQNCVIFGVHVITHHKIVRIPVSYFQVPRVKLASFIGVHFYGDFSDVSFPPLMPLKRKGIIRLPKLSFRLGLGTSFYSSTTYLSIGTFVCLFVFFLLLFFFFLTKQN